MINGHKPNELVDVSLGTDCVSAGLADSVPYQWLEAVSAAIGGGTTKDFLGI